MQCFKCTNTFQSTNDLFTHIKSIHKVPNKSTFVCMLCDELFKEIGRYKNHVEICFSKNNIDDEVVQLRRAEVLEAHNDIAMEDVHLSEFNAAVRKSALEFACKMNATMTFPRSLVFQTILDLQNFVRTITDGT